MGGKQDGQSLADLALAVTYCGFKLTETGTIGFKLKVGDVEISPSASISNEISQSLKVTTTTSYVETSEVTEQVTVQLPAGRYTEVCGPLSIDSNCIALVIKPC